MTTDNICFYLQNRLIQTSQTGGQRYTDTSPFSIPWPNHSGETRLPNQEEEKGVILFLNFAVVKFAFKVTKWFGKNRPIFWKVAKKVAKLETIF